MINFQPRLLPFTLATALFLPLLASVSVLDPQARRCIDDLGGVVLFDRPCESPKSQSKTVDITSHQGHRAATPQAFPRPISPDNGPQIILISASDPRFSGAPSQSNATLMAGDLEIGSLLLERNRII